LPPAKIIGSFDNIIRLCRNQASLASRRASGYRNTNKKSGRQQP